MGFVFHGFFPVDRTIALIQMIYVPTVVQTVKCLKLKREGASQCYFCVAHKAYDSCRFIGIRQLLYEQGMVREDRLVSNRQHVELQLPLTWNVKVPSHEQIAHIKVGVVPRGLTFTEYFCR
jgi:hypothetical protein